MERDLNFRRLFKMYLLNVWLIILIGIIAAIGVVGLIRGTNETTVTRAVYLVYDLNDTGENDLEAKKNSYFDAYRALLRGNTLTQSGTFTDEEQDKLAGLNVEVESSCYTITMQGEDLGEDDAAVLDKYIDASQEWMREKFQDDSIEAEIVRSNMETSSGRSIVLNAAIGFIIGVVLAVIGLFIWFVADQKIRNEEDVVYYTGLKCLAVVKRR
nr:hypothetical protein [uncultured Mediterraneibacter sp.]